MRTSVRCRPFGEMWKASWIVAMISEWSESLDPGAASELSSLAAMDVFALATHITT